jgi:hemerythrin
MFEWKDDYSVGVNEIDIQHKHLISIGAELMDLVKHHSSDDLYDDVVDAIERLRDYTVYHFDAEEKLMAESGYDDIEAHKELHRRFIEKIDDIDLTAIDENQTEFVMDILKFISTWVVKHIIGDDFKYSDTVQNYMLEMAQ